MHHLFKVTVKRIIQKMILVQTQRKIMKINQRKIISQKAIKKTKILQNMTTNMVMMMK